MQDRIGQSVSVGDTIITAEGSILCIRTVVELDEETRLVRAVKPGEKERGRALRACEFIVDARRASQHEPPMLTTEDQSPLAGHGDR